MYLDKRKVTESLDSSHMERHYHVTSTFQKSRSEIVDYKKASVVTNTTFDDNTNMYLPTIAIFQIK